MILFLIIMICLFSSILAPRPYYGWYGRRFYRPMFFGPMMRGPRMHHHHMGPRGPMGGHHGPGHGPRI